MPLISTSSIWHLASLGSKSPPKIPSPATWKESSDEKIKILNLPFSHFISSQTAAWRIASKPASGGSTFEDTKVSSKIFSKFSTWSSSLKIIWKILIFSQCFFKIINYNIYFRESLLQIETKYFKEQFLNWLLSTLFKAQGENDFLI